MEKRVNTILNVCYYAFYVLAIGSALLMWYLVTNGKVSAIETLSDAGKAIQYVVIGYVIVSVAGGLYLFKRALDKIRQLADRELQLRRYQQWAIVRIVLIGLGIVLGIVAFYWLGGYRSMIWCAAISTIGLYFCKPTLRRMELELDAPVEQSEN